MEALAVLSVACNIMQVIQFGHETVSICRSMYNDKSPAADVAYNGDTLRNVSKDLQASIASIPSKSLQTDEKELQCIATKVVALADDLQKELQKCQVSSGSPKMAVFGKALKYNWSRKKRVDELEKGLGMLQSTMQSRILLNLRCVAVAAVFLMRYAVYDSKQKET
jgi:hypothetical protein